MCGCRGHLDLSLTLLSQPGALGGILGSTLLMPTNNHLNGTMDAEDHSFHDAGHEDNYLVSGLFDNLPASSRRRLIETDTIGKLSFPLTAGLSYQA